MADLESIFNRFSGGNPRAIPQNNLEAALKAAGQKDVSAAMQTLRMLDPEQTGLVTLEQFSALVNARGAPNLGADDGSAAPNAPTLDEGPDPRVTEFLKVLEEYRTKCELEGNYEEASRCTDQLASIRKAEEERRIMALKARHVVERGQVSEAHRRQFQEFNDSWERYLAEYDAMAQMYVAQMNERHGQRLREFQVSLHGELTKKPVKQGREVLEWRTREAQLVKQRLYSEASRVKAVADELERKERQRLDEERLNVFAGREAKFRQAQQAEMSALLKRIDTRRAEHTKQWETDNKRLVQRNRNVMAVLEQRQAAEEQKKVQEIRTQLAPPRVVPVGTSKLDTGVRKKTGSSPMAATASSSVRQAQPGLADTLAGAGEAEAAALAAAMSGEAASAAQVAQALSFSGGPGASGTGGLGNRTPGSAKQLVMRSQAGVSAAGPLTASAGATARSTGTVRR